MSVGSSDTGQVELVTSQSVSPLVDLSPREARKKRRGQKLAWIRGNWDLYLLLAPTIAYFIIFHYIPMYGVQIAFKDFSPMKGILGSDWIGFENFRRFFASYQFWVLLRNTLLLSLYETLAGFPVPVILALMINSVRAKRFQRTVQTVTYAPHFISTVVIAGMLYLFLSPRNGFVNEFIGLFGIKPIFFMGEAGWFRDIFVFSGIWQTGGWSAIIYLAALTSVNPELHESAVIDGASKFQRIRHIDLPTIVPTIVILLILNVGRFMTVSFQKVLLMQNYLNIETAEIIQTYVYKTGLLGAQFSYSAAIGLFNNVVNMILLVSVNRIAKMLRQTSLW